MYEHVEPEAGQDRVLELGVLVHYDGDDADVGEEPPRPANHVLAGQPVLPGRVQTPAVQANSIECRNHFWLRKMTSELGLVWSA